MKKKDKKSKRICALILAAVLAVQVPVTVHAGLGDLIYSIMEKLYPDLKQLVQGLITRVPESEYSLLNGILTKDDPDLIDIPDDGEDESESGNLVNKVLFIGDSRTEGLRDVTNNSAYDFYCLSSQGYSWMVNDAFPNCEPKIGEGVAVVIMLGVNDVYNKNRYLLAVNQKAKEWTEKGAIVYYAGIGPVENDPYVTNEEIKDFNSTISNGLKDATFIDVFTQLTNTGYHTVDGTHYDNNTSVQLLNFLGETALNGRGSVSTGNRIWWNEVNRETSYLTYQFTNWAKFEGIDVSLFSGPQLKAIISDDLKDKVQELEAAAKEYEFLPYKELFKAIAQYRHQKNDPDIFRIEDTGLNPNPGHKVSEKDSISISAELFADCLSVAGYPSPSNVEGLKALLQAFEFERDNYIEYCHNKYSVETAEKYAAKCCGNKLRTNENEIAALGKYDFHDQKFPGKVLKYYSVISFNNTSLSEDEQKLLQEAMAGWLSDMDSNRSKVIEKGLSLYGKITYSMDNRLQPSAENPQYLDCSSFVGWSFNKAGFTDVQYFWCTGDFLSSSSFTQIDHSQLQPGDIGLINWVGAGGSNHVGIYVGKSSLGNDVWLHCTGGSLRRIVINSYGGFKIFFKYRGFQ